MPAWHACWLACWVTGCSAGLLARRVQGLGHRLHCLQGANMALIHTTLLVCMRSAGMEQRAEAALQAAAASMAASLQSKLVSGQAVQVALLEALPPEQRDSAGTHATGGAGPVAAGVEAAAAQPAAAPAPASSAIVARLLAKAAAAGAEQPAGSLAHSPAGLEGVLAGLQRLLPRHVPVQEEDPLPGLIDEESRVVASIHLLLEDLEGSWQVVGEELQRTQVRLLAAVQLLWEGRVLGVHGYGAVSIIADPAWLGVRNPGGSRLHTWIDACSCTQLVTQKHLG